MTWRAGVLALVLGFASVAHAQPPADGVATVAERAGRRALDAVRECSRGPLIVRVDNALPAAAPDPHGLIARLLAPMLEGLRADDRFEAVHVGSFGRDDTHPSASAARLGYRSMLEARFAVVGGQLEVTLRSWSTPQEDAHRRHVLRRRLDVALRRHLGFPPRVTEDTVDARFGVLPGRGYLAVTALDINGDGRVEVVAVHERGARVFRVGEGRARHRLEEIGRAPWPDDVPATATPRRRSLATAVNRGRAVVVRHSAFSVPIEVAWEAGAVVTRRAQGPCPDARYPVRGGCAQLVDGRDFFDDILEREGEPYEAAMHFYAFESRRFETQQPGHATVEALINPAGRLVMRIVQEPPEGDAIPHSAGAVGYGTALGMADLDLDGAAELLLSHAAPAGGGDQLSLLRAFPRGAVRVVWRSEVLAGSVWAAASGDVDGDGLDELIAIEEPQNPDRGRARLWIVQ